MFVAHLFQIKLLLFLAVQTATSLGAVVLSVLVDSGVDGHTHTTCLVVALYHLHRIPFSLVILLPFTFVIKGHERTLFYFWDEDCSLDVANPTIFITPISPEI